MVDLLQWRANSKLKICLLEFFFFSNFTIPVNKTEADSEEATNKNARGCVFACNLECWIAVEVVVVIIIVLVLVPALEDTDEYEAKYEV